MRNKVFISYAKEDFEKAEELYYQLYGNSYEPWLDKHNLLVGQDWNNEIRLALRKADYIIVLLSNNSVNKRGYVQREFKLALEYCEEKLEDDIYIIPCKLDDCAVPSKLSKYQWIELDTPNSFDAIIRSLDAQRVKYEKETIKKIAGKHSFGYEDAIFEKIIEGKPKSTTKIVYPKFTNIEKEDLRFLNSKIEREVLDSYLSFDNPEGLILFYDELWDGDDIEFDYPADFTFDVSYKMELVSQYVISISIFTYWYTGGAHGLYGTKGYNYKLDPFAEITLEKLLDNQETVLHTLHVLCKKRLLEKANKLERIDNDTDFFLSENPLKKEWSTFNNFYLTSKGIVIIFSIYQETAYAWGQHEVLISYAELIGFHPLLKTLKKIQELVSKDFPNP